MQDFDDLEDPPPETIWDLLSFAFENHGGTAAVWFLGSFLVGAIAGPWIYLPAQLATICVFVWLIVSIRRNRPAPAIRALFNPLFCTAMAWIGIWSGIELTLFWARISNPITP
jgi:hypothetical protein